MITFQKILCPIDFSDFSSLALKYAVSMAMEYGSQLIALHSLPEPLFIAGFPNTIPPVQFDSTEATEKINHLLSRYIPSQVSFVKRTEVGSPSRAILNTAERDDCDLIVMATHGKSRKEAFLIGSVTNEVLNKSKIPVLVVCRPERDFITEDPYRPVEIKNILCAVSPDARVEQMIQLALTFAKQYQARILFYQVTDPSDIGQTGRFDLDQVQQMITPEDRDWCEIRSLTDTGDPAEQILRVAQEQKADLIFMGHHTRRPLALNILGSVALVVTRDSSCPVMVIRE